MSKVLGVRNVPELVELASKLSGGIPEGVFTGGSGAASVKMHYPGTSKTTIIKLATTDGSGLNNGRRKIIREAKQIISLKKHYPEQLGPILPDVLNSWQSNWYGAIELPFYEGQSFANYLRTHTTKETLEQLTPIVTATIKAYKLSYARSTSNTFLDEKLIARARFRIRYTKRGDDILQNMLLLKKIVINGVAYENPAQIIEKITRDQTVIDSLKSRYLSDCVHGDLNLANVFLTPYGLRFIDLRGSRQKWDMFYDLAKMIFTAGYDRICHFEFEPQLEADGSYTLSYADANNDVHNKWETVESSLETIYTHTPEFKQIIENEPNWRLKLRFMHAVHYIADAACRVEAGSPLNQAFASYMMGTIFLNRVFNDLTATTSATAHYGLLLHGVKGSKGAPSGTAR